MKWVAALLVVLGSSSLAVADENDLAAPAPNVLMEPYAPFKLVGVMPDTGQVLLWDENAMAYRLSKPGEDLDGWRVSGLDLKDARGPRLALQKEDLIDELELVRLPRPGAVIVFKDARDRATVTPAAPAPAAQAIPPTVIAAPLETGTSSPVATGAPSPAPARTAPQAQALPPQLRPAAPPAPPPAPPPPAVLEETRVIPRGDLDRQMNDFDTLMATVDVAPVQGGGFQITRLEPGSFVEALGFQQGDVVRTLAGDRVSTVEDAARVYARLRSAPGFAAEVERGDARLLLRFEVKDGK